MLLCDDSWELYFDGFEVYSQGAQDIFDARGGSGDDTNRLSLEYYLQHKEKNSELLFQAVILMELPLEEQRLPITGI